MDFPSSAGNSVKGKRTHAILFVGNRKVLIENDLLRVEQVHARFMQYDSHFCRRSHKLRTLFERVSLARSLGRCDAVIDVTHNRERFTSDNANSRSQRLPSLFSQRFVSAHSAL